MATLVRRYFATLRPVPRPPPTSAPPGPPGPALCLPSLPLSQELERQRKTEQIIPNTKRQNGKKCLKSLTKICCLYIYILHTSYIYIYTYIRSPQRLPQCAQAGRGRQRQHALHKIPNFLLFFIVFFSSASNNKKTKKKNRKKTEKNKRKAETKETCKRNVQDCDASTALYRYIDYTMSYTISYCTMLGRQCVNI